MAAQKTWIQKDLFGDDKHGAISKSRCSNGKDAYSKGSLRRVLEDKYE